MLKRALRRIRRWRAPDHVTCDGVRLPPPHLRFCGAEFQDDRYFLASARREARRLVDEAGLTSQGRVLDVGCGPGRLAIGLLDLPGGVAGYLGLDVHRPSIDWCTRNLGRAHPAFRFHHVDVRNDRYNPDGTQQAGAVRLPAESASHDVAYLYSVFSHMLPAGVKGYLHELHRVLAPGGTLFFTGFVETDVPEVSVNPPGYVRSWSGPLHCVRYERGYLERMLREAGFAMEKLAHGTETDRQSAIFARRTP
ncbi:MAG TPA: class I SAM-dependent methyltransferase [Longimicrobium sp.]|jgi:SAM-dependent methyltransferase